MDSCPDTPPGEILVCGLGGLGQACLASLMGFEISTAGVSHAELMIFGALIVWFLIVEPHGLAKLWSIGKQKMRVWPFPY
jgi:ABC-type branched-subunit amino acid transport system permease subunit